MRAFTIDTWVRLDTPGAPVKDIERFVTIYGPGTIALRHDGSTNPGQLYFYMDVDGRARHIRSDGVLRVGAFMHIAATYDGSVLRLYLDGAEMDSLPVKGSVTAGSGGVGLSCSTEESLYGLLDEVSIYNRALIPEEILAIYQAGSAGKCKPR